MAALLLAFCGFALLDSLNVLNVGVASAVVYDSRLNRRSAVPGGLSFIAGVFAVTTTFGVCMVLGLTFLTNVVGFELTPTIRYRGELALGLVLIGVACLPRGLKPATPTWASTMTRERPWLLGFVGIAIGLGQAPTAVPYLTALAMLSARSPLPPMWPLMVIAYCAIVLLPPLLVVALSTRRTTRAQRMQRNLVRVLNRYGPTSVRILFLCIGIALCADALLHHSELWTPAP
jgi:cytochrome c biogenesis protein CcdA